MTFSPDSKWLTYTRDADNEITVVYVYDIAGKKEYPVTDKWYNSSSPVFSTDGKYLVFSSARDFNPTYGWLEWNHVYNNMYGVYLALLSKDTPSPFIQKDAGMKNDSESEAPKAAEKTAGKKDAKQETASASLVKFDPEGITDRIIKLPLSASYYTNFYSNGKKVYYWGNGGTKFLILKVRKKKRLPMVL